VARIEWVQQRLDNWALWATKRDAGGLGFAPSSIFANGPAARGGSNEAVVPVDELDAAVTNDAVESLKLGHGHLYQTLRLYYLKGQGIKQTARTMRRAESTIHAQLAQADQRLALWFQERRRRGDSGAAALSVATHLAMGPASLAALKPKLRDRRRPTRAAVQTSAPVPAPEVALDPPPRRRRPVLRLKGRANPEEA